MCCRPSGSVCAAPDRSPAAPAQPLQRERGERSAGRNPSTSAGAGEGWGQTPLQEPPTDQNREISISTAVIYCTV